MSSIEGGQTLKAWKRTCDCRLCGQDRCVLSMKNNRMGYCFRFGKIFFQSNDRRYGIEEMNSKVKKKVKEQSIFDFGVKHFDPS